MDNFNKIISFILGLVVVVVLLAVTSGRLDLKKKFLPSLKINQSAPTSPTPISKKPTPKVVSPPSISKTVYNHYQTKEVSSIPSTGAPTILFPVVFSTLLTGLYLRKKSK